MLLTEVIEILEEFDVDQTIYVADNAPDAVAAVDYETDDGDIPASAKGMCYLLEVSRARDAIRVWSDWREGRQPTLDEKVQAVIYYAENDAFMPGTKRGG
ncbi:hypothetical protein V5E97_02430 [Singulisphaera sp. Ch08]|uniref:DUF7716 domain-containing protein n=1 Tax=Singulisphaera sp. Ch08 TaxID=3120278 RepID=A0AAU7CII6_9BACT